MWYYGSNIFFVIVTAVAIQSVLTVQCYHHALVVELVQVNTHLKGLQRVANVGHEIKLTLARQIRNSQTMKTNKSNPIPLAPCNCVSSTFHAPGLFFRQYTTAVEYSPFLGNTYLTSLAPWRHQKQNDISAPLSGVWATPLQPHPFWSLLCITSVAVDLISACLVVVGTIES